MEEILKSKEFDASSAMKSKDAALRFTATFGLYPKSDAGFQALVQTLKDEDPGVRIMAAMKLAKDADVRSQMHHSPVTLTPKPSRSSGQ